MITVMSVQDSAIRGREWALDRLSGVWQGRVLNAPKSAVSPIEAGEGLALAAQLKHAMNQLKVEGFSSGGDAVHYARLQDSRAYHAYQTMTHSLVEFDPLTLGTPQVRLTFWINLYNALIIDAVIAQGVEQSVTEGLLGIVAFFRRAAYLVGGQRVSAEDIEHGILRANRGNPFIPGPHFLRDDPRREWGLLNLDPRIHFALNCASLSCPPIGVYDAQRIDAQLDLAARSYVAQTTAIDYKTGRLCVSRLFSWFAADFGGQAGVIDFLRRHLPHGNVHTWLVDQGSSVQLAYGHYDWSLNAAVGLESTSAG